MDQSMLMESTVEDWWTNRCWWNQPMRIDGINRCWWNQQMRIDGINRCWWNQQIRIDGINRCWWNQQMRIDGINLCWWNQQMRIDGINRCWFNSWGLMESSNVDGINRCWWNQQMRISAFYWIKIQYHRISEFYWIKYSTIGSPNSTGFDTIPSDLRILLDKIQYHRISEFYWIKYSTIGSLSSGGSRENAAISSLGASLGVGSWSSWCSESPWNWLRTGLTRRLSVCVTALRPLLTCRRRCLLTLTSAK
jgi:hypothetical protein